MISQNNLFPSAEALENELDISLNSNCLPLESSLSKVGRCMVCYCLKGWVEVEVNLVKHRMTESGILVLFPAQIVEQKAVSDDFQAIWFSMSPGLFQDVIFRFPPEFVSFLQQHFFYKVTPDSLQEEYTRFALIQKMFNDTRNVCRREIILNMLRIFFLELYDKIQRKELSEFTTRQNRRVELFEAFVNMVMASFKTKRDVNFYAQALFITPKYLSMVTLDVTGIAAKQWIDDYVVLELKIRLKSTRDSLQQIAHELNFADQAFLCKYFKQRTGLSPTEYRKLS